MNVAVVAVLSAVGCLFVITGAVGILRMPDLYLRVQCSTLINTLGLIPLLIALVVAEGPITSYGSRALIVAFLSLTLGPAAGHALTRSAHRAGVPVWHGAVAHESLALKTERKE